LKLSPLYIASESTLQRLTTGVHCAAKLVKNVTPRTQVTSTLRELHWFATQVSIYTEPF